jgi:hypothetical protein
MIKDLKIYLLNSSTIALSFTGIENSLKILLLLLSIIYTIVKIHETIKNKKDANK